VDTTLRMGNEQVLVLDLGDARVYQGQLASFENIRAEMAHDLLLTEPFNAGKWQALDVSGSSAHNTFEMLNVTLRMPMTGSDQQSLAADTMANLPWAEDHFQERVGGDPVNPGKAEAYWPYHNGQGDLHKRAAKKYDHNYMERMWCRQLSWETCTSTDHPERWGWPGGFQGVRFEVGDLGSVVKLLQREPGTRQAYLPIWFPEDTGATQVQRVPCSLGYHFIVRNGKLHLQYNLRSVEVYRHFHNDVYMAVRLAQWVAEQVGVEELGWLTMHMVSFHGFVGDTDRIVRMTK